MTIEQKTCLTCKWLETLERPQRFLSCLVPLQEVIPLCMTSWMKSPVNTDHPHVNCPTWKEKDAKKT